MSNEVLIAIISSLGGGVLLSVVNKALNSSKERFEWGAQYRDELRKDIDALETENERLEADVRAARKAEDEWRQRYYDLRDSIRNP